MLTRRPIRHRLLLVAALGVFTSALAGVAIYRAIAVTTAQRIERARDAIAEELNRLQSPAAADAPEDLPSVVGMRAGTATDVAGVARAVPPAWRASIEALAARVLTDHAAVEGEWPIAGGNLVGRAAPASAAAGGARIAWAAMAVKPSPNLQSWRALVMALAVSTLLLVAAAASALISVKRGAGTLQVALDALAQDLSAPIPRTSVRELGDIADGIATLARHLAEARQIQERLSRDLSRQERLAALGRVVAGVAHEVRNPLASIKLRLDLALGNASALPPPLRAAISHASSEIMRLDRLVADLLIVSGRLLGPRKPLDAGALLRARVETLAPWAAQREITVRVRGGGPAVADPDALARAIDNLIRNAIEASPAGGVVEASVEPAPHPGDSDGARNGDGQSRGAKADVKPGATSGAALHIRVEDRGEGVAPERAGELFEPFFTTKADGTGLGLAISRAIARAHGGDLVYARAGERTRFDLTLPAPEATEALAPVTEAAS